MTSDTVTATEFSRLREIDEFAKTDEIRNPGYVFKQVENWTVQQEGADDVSAKITNLFKLAREEDFEDGVESNFARELATLIRRYEHEAVAVLSHFIVGELVSGEVAFEALRLLGRINHPPTYRGRLWLLERSLRCTSPWIRDGATIGLALLDDPSPAKYLREAIQRERIEELREDMEQVLLQLETH
jgi:hypothetical protein